MDSGTFKGLDTFIFVLMGICVVSVPLGLWKLVEIIMWFFSHVSWN